MLLSQRIAKDMTFLKKYAGDKTNLFELRMKIMQAVKVIAPKELFFFSSELGEETANIYGTQRSDYQKQKAIKKLQHYQQFAKMPFPLMFLEDGESGMLVEQRPGCIAIQRVLHNGQTLAFATLVSDIAFGATDDDVDCEVGIAWFGGKPGHMDAEGTDKVKELALIEAALVREILLFMNVKNAPLHHYVPTKKENSMVPKAMLPAYEYHILDLFREVKQYASLAEVEAQQVVSKNNHAQRRTHMVRGHFKQLKTGLYWWNPFTRCRKNRDIVGVVEKDYRLHAA